MRARAERAPPPSPSRTRPPRPRELAQSRAYFDQANKLYDDGKYPEAEQAYLAAWNLTKSYDVAGNLGTYSRPI